MTGHAGNTMSYRHRVGVLLSILWLIVLPIYVLVETNQRAQRNPRLVHEHY